MEPGIPSWSLHSGWSGMVGGPKPGIKSWAAFSLPWSIAEPEVPRIGWSVLKTQHPVVAFQVRHVSDSSHLL
jgi:hypothetical protein